MLTCTHEKVNSLLVHSCITNKRNTSEDKHFETLTSSCRFCQHLNQIQCFRKSSSCLDFVTTNQSNLVFDLVVHLSLHMICLHQINFCKLEINIQNLHLQQQLCETPTVHILRRKGIYLTQLLGQKCSAKNVMIFPVSSSNAKSIQISLQSLMIELYLHLKMYLNSFPRKLKYAKLGKSTRLTFLVPVPKVVEVIRNTYIIIFCIYSSTKPYRDL